VARTRSDSETIDFGRELGARLPAGAVVFLIGNLGAGKTTLAKGIVEGVGAASRDEVSSPTFTLIHEYGDPVRVYHVDLYRLDSEREVAALGLDELFDSGSLVLIEWGERFPGLLREGRVEVRLRRLENEEREIVVTGLDG